MWRRAAASRFVETIATLILLLEGQLARRFEIMNNL
jgi:hypothetical protein